MSSNQSKFDIWWNSPTVKRVVGIFYSVGASVVIVGAMGKILHTSWGGAMLGLGMGVEAFLFLMGVFDKPHEDYDWNNHFAQNGVGSFSVGTAVSSSATTVASKSVGGINYSESISDDDLKSLTEGIKNLSTTAQQLNSLGSIVSSSDKLSKTLDSASDAAGKYLASQDSLNSSANQLNSSYAGIIEGMGSVEKNTKVYAGRIDEINKNLSSINSMYEIQLQNIKAQSEGLNKQTEAVRVVSNDFSAISTEVQKMKLASVNAAEQTENFKTGTVKLAKQVADLTEVYGNMLNAVS